MAGVWAYIQQEGLSQFKLVKLVIFELFVIMLSQVWEEKSKISNCEANDPNMKLGSMFPEVSQIQ